MAYDRFLIAPFKSGLVTATTPWMIPEDAFEELNNAYIYKGVIRKRPGSRYTGFNAATSIEQQLKSRLRLDIGTTDGVGIITGIVPGVQWNVGQMFSVGNNIYTVYEDGVFPLDMLSTWTGAIASTFDTSTGAFTIDSQHNNTTCYYYPALPVMGIHQLEVGTSPNRTKVTYAFDTQFVYYFDEVSGGWLGDGFPLWHGGNHQFFWATSWFGADVDDNALFVTNYNSTAPAPALTDDPFYYSSDGVLWIPFQPRFLAAGPTVPVDRYVRTAKIIMPFHGRLLLFNTLEDDAGGVNRELFVNRCRWSAIGSPFPELTRWLPGTARDTGGFLDAPTTEAIISVSYVKDRIIVYFEHSTWELVYVYNFSSPFAWQQLNASEGSESTFSTVEFDRASLTVGQSGVYACSGANVEKMSNNIDRNTASIRITDFGVARVHGIRNLSTELVYWAYPSIDADEDSSIYPDKLLIYNYDNGAWGTADDCITAFGKFDHQSALAWETGFWFWRQMNQIWDADLGQALSRKIVAGNQQGFVFIVDPDVSVNEAVMQITNVEIGLWLLNPDVLLTIISHTLNTGDYIRIENLTGVLLLGEGIYQVTVENANQVTFFTGFPVVNFYRGGGTAARVSKIEILSKQWNFYNNLASNIFIPKIDFCVQRTEDGEVALEYSVSSSNVPLANDAELTGSALGVNVLQTAPYALVPFEQTLDRFWHPVYVQAEGENVQIKITSNDDQMLDPDVQGSDFQLEGIVVYAKRTGARFE